jgi:hypothetical protein
MADRPIIFSAPMVLALLAWRKTQTRRVVKNVPPQPAPNCHPSHTARHPAPYLDAYCGEKPTPANPRGMGRNWHWWQVDDRPGVAAFRLPYAPGDRLWVREAHAFGPLDPPPVIYAATAKQDGWEVGPKARYRSPIHMPRWASRLTLAVTEVRVQRLQEISEQDAYDEGIESDLWDQAPVCRNYQTGGWFIGWPCNVDPPDQSVPADEVCRQSYATLWNSIHGPDAWAANDWVCALTFTVTRGNIDVKEIAP